MTIRHAVHFFVANGQNFDTVLSCAKEALREFGAARGLWVSEFEYQPIGPGLEIQGQHYGLSATFSTTANGGL